MSVAQACPKKGTLSSSEDETSNDVTPLGEGLGTKPTDDEPLAELATVFNEKAARKRRQHMIVRLTRKVEEMVLEDECVLRDVGPSVKTPGPTSASLATCSGRRQQTVQPPG
jgi:hypothetical protein